MRPGNSEQPFGALSLIGRHVPRVEVEAAVFIAYDNVRTEMAVREVPGWPGLAQRADLLALPVVTSATALAVIEKDRPSV